MKLLASLLFTLFLTASPAALAQQVYVNEIMASNQVTLADPDYSEFGDWFELHNATDNTVDLGGHFVTDNFSQPTKWRIPDGTLIAPNGYLIVWADDYNTGPPTTLGLHANFKLSGGGERVGLYTSTGAVVDTMSFGAQTSDVSYGRYPDGAAVRAFFGTPTPGAANNTSPSGGVAETPSVSRTSGFYAGGETVQMLTVEPDAVIRYTLDGSDPTEASTAYAGPLTLTETTVLRLAAFAPGRLTSPVVTRTFFVGESSDLPVISLVTDPAGFFSNESGIYVRGTNGITGLCSTTPVNWNQDWERAVHMTFFEPDGAGGFDVALDQGAGAQIFGGCSRIYAQKSLSLHARSRYGASDFGYRFFEDADVDSFDDLVLRSSAQDWWRTMFRDGMIQTLTRHMDLDGQAYRPTAVFLNGDYWGIHNLREKLNEDYVAGHYGIADSDVELLDAEKEPLRGRSAHYDQLLDLLDANNMNQPAAFAQLESMMEVDQFTNYLIAEIYSANADWPGNNLKLWRPRTPEGRWRWMFFDLDFGFGGNGQGLATSNTLALATATNGPDWPNPPWSTYLFRKLLENDGFRHTFVQRLAAHMNTTFAPARVIGVIDSLQANIASEMPRHKTRWTQSASFGTSWNGNVDIMRAFANDRAPNMRSHVAQYFAEVPGSTALNVSVTDGGQVRAEGVALPRGSTAAPFVSVFFRGVPLDLVAVPDDGYTFTGWTGLVNSAADSVSVVLTGTASITATFALITAGAAGATPESHSLSTSFPNPATHSAAVEATLARPTALSVRVYDMLGREVATLADGRLTESGTHRLTLDVRALPSGVYTVVMNADDVRLTRRMVVAR